MIAVIIDDEPRARNLLRLLLQKHCPQVREIHEAADLMEGIACIRKQRPQLVFLDIEMPEHSGLELPDFLEPSEMTFSLIFTTAYDQYAIKAFKTTGIDYLLKPVSEEELAAALEKYQKLNPVQGEEWLMKNLEAMGLINQQHEVRYKERFLLKSGMQMVPVKATDIAWFYRKDELVYARTFDGGNYLADQALNQLQKLVDPNLFFRLNRQVLTNLDAIHKLKNFKPGQVTVMLSPDFPEELHLSQERSSRLKMVLGSH